MELSKREGDKFIKALKDALDGKRRSSLDQKGQVTQSQKDVVQGS